MMNIVITEASKLLKVVSNEKRLEILYSLMNKELKVGELEKLVGLSQSALSQHLAVLRSADLVRTRRDSQTIFYSVRSDKVIKLLNFLEELYLKRY